MEMDNLYDIDSPEDFMRFAIDHYGELGLLRLNIFASNDRQQEWKIVVANSYSSNAGFAIEVATALYNVGAPLLIYDAEKFLRIMYGLFQTCISSIWGIKKRGPSTNSCGI